MKFVIMPPCLLAGRKCFIANGTEFLVDNGIIDLQRSSIKRILCKFRRKEEKYFWLFSFESSHTNVTFLPFLNDRNKNAVLNWCNAERLQNTPNKWKTISDDIARNAHANYTAVSWLFHTIYIRIWLLSSHFVFREISPNQRWNGLSIDVLSVQ